MAELLTAARPYAKALYDVASNGDVSKWMPIMEICQELGGSEDSRDFLKSPGLSNERFSKVIDSLAKHAKVKKLPKEFENFTKVLFNNKRFSLLPEIATLFVEQVNQSNDTIVAEIFTAMSLTDDSRENLIKKLEKRYGKTVEASIEIDKSLIGGAVIKIGDTVIDGSVKGRIEQLTKALN